jgi:hypothetical protein
MGKTVAADGYQLYSSQQFWSDTYLTDPALVRALGPFAVDPCCPPSMPWRTARRMLHHGQVNGLTAPWGRGRAWLNPPYRGMLPWAQRFAAHGSGVALLNGRAMETRASQLLLGRCAGAFFPAGRLCWYREDGTLKTIKSGEPMRWIGSLLVGMTPTDADLLRRLPERGFPGAFLVGPEYGLLLTALEGP